MLNYNARLKSFSKKLRTEMTDAEQLLWKYVRRKQLCDIQFYRQKPMGHYIQEFRTLGRLFHIARRCFMRGTNCLRNQLTKPFRTARFAARNIG